MNYAKNWVTNNFLINLLYTKCKLKNKSKWRGEGLMNFYQLMQLGAANLKPLIKNEEDKKLKQKYMTAFVLKNILCLLFCMAVVVFFGAVFGNENSIVGVVTVVSLLAFRFSNLDFDVKQSAFTIFGIFCILMVGPYLASISTPIIKFVINFISIIAIVILACHNVKLSNQSILVLSYLLLCGYEISNINVYINRVLALALGGIIVAIIFYIRQRNVKFENKFSDIIKGFDFRNERTKWQLKFTLAICSSVLIGDLLNLPRTIWIGFACMSIVQPNKDRIDIRYKERVPFAILGCIIYYILYIILPEEFKALIGIIGGLMLGFSATYKWQTIFNSFGALTSAAPILGLEIAIIFRIIENTFGAIYGRFFSKIFDKFEEKITTRNINKKITGNNTL